MRVSPEDIMAARAVPIAEVAARYGASLKRDGRDLVGPCLVCGGDDRFAVHPRKGIFLCRQCDVSGDVIALVQHVERCDFTRAVSVLTGQVPDGFDPAQVEAAKQKQAHDDDLELQGRIASAVKRWEESSPALGPVAAYLREVRGLRDFDDLAGTVLRFNPRLPWMGHDGHLVRVPAMVAAMRHVQTGELVGIHRTVIAPDGRSKIARRGLGSLRHAAVMLDRPGDDPAELTLAEGIETGIAARMLGFKRVWCLYSTSNVRSLPVLQDVSRLILLEENDANGASPKACAACAGRWDAAGAEVTIVRPRAGLSDMNDVILKERAQ